MQKDFILGQRPALDGLRGVSVLLVILCHLDTPWFNLRGGWFGVQIFYVLSGFLITSLLIDEWKRTGTISIRAFYARRLLRLAPALLAVLALVIIVSSLISTPEEAGRIRSASLITLLYSSNWFIALGKFPAPEVLCHSWSLSVEEQFYIVWPVVLFALLRIRSLTALLWIVSGLVVLLSSWRAYLWVTTSDKLRVFFGSDTNAAAILVGVIVSLLMATGRYPTSAKGVRAATISGAIMTVLIPVGLLTLTPYVSGTHDWWMYVGGVLGVDIAAGILIMALLVSPVKDLFSHRPLVWTGRVSYGLYLWHYPALWWARDHAKLGSLAEPVAVALTFVVAALSFYLLEKPFLRLKGRFQRDVPVLVPSMESSG